MTRRGGRQDADRCTTKQRETARSSGRSRTCAVSRQPDRRMTRTACRIYRETISPYRSSDQCDLSRFCGFWRSPSGTAPVTGHQAGSHLLLIRQGRFVDSRRSERRDHPPASTQARCRRFEFERSPQSGRVGGEFALSWALSHKRQGTNGNREAFDPHCRHSQTLGIRFASEVQHCSRRSKGVRAVNPHLLNHRTRCNGHRDRKHSILCVSNQRVDAAGVRHGHNTRIESAVRCALRFSGYMPLSAVEVVVCGGHVTLRGTLPT